MRAIRAGSVAQRVIEHLSKPGAPASITAREIAEMCGGFPEKDLTNRIRPALERGAIEREREGRRFRYRLPRPNPIAWIAAQAQRLDLPCGAGERLQQSSTQAAETDPVERCAAWISSTGRRITWVETSEHFGWSRYYAMRRLREGAERGLLRRIPSENSQRPDLFEGAR
ncbi:MAG TPA: hypothetical protein VGE10_11055 [Zeimonas sp.]